MLEVHEFVCKKLPPPGDWGRHTPAFAPPQNLFPVLLQDVSPGVAAFGARLASLVNALLLLGFCFYALIVLGLLSSNEGAWRKTTICQLWSFSSFSTPLHHLPDRISLPTSTLPTSS